MDEREREKIWAAISTLTSLISHLKTRDICLQPDPLAALLHFEEELTASSKKPIIEPEGRMSDDKARRLKGDCAHYNSLFLEKLRSDVAANLDR